jgi:glycosyltransferase involved in cell wall biosynthesis
MKKILVVTTTFLPTIAGTEIEIYNIISKLQKLDYDVTLLLPSWYAKKIDNDMIKVKIISYPSIILSVWSKLFNLINISYFGRVILRTVIAKIDPDIIFFYFVYPTAVFFDTPSFKDKNIILVPQGVDVQTDKSSNYGFTLNNKIKELVKRCMFSARSVLYMGESMKSSIIHILGEDLKKLKFVPTATEVEKISRYKSDRGKLLQSHNSILNTNDVCILLSVGRNHPKKGFDLIPQLCKKIMEREPGQNFVWFIIGKDSDLINIPNELKGTIITIDPIGLKKDELSTPPCDLIEYYKIADIFCAPTKVEGLSLTFLDILASKTPIVSTKCDGVVDIIEHQVSGMLSDAGDIDTMVDNISTIINNPDLSDRITNNGFDIASTYDWKFVMEKYVDIIEDKR